MTVLTDTDTFTAEWEAWHASRDAYFAEPHGWVAITSLHWLTAEPVVFDEFPGRWTAAPGQVLTIEAAAQDGLVLPDGDVVDGVSTLDPVEGGPGLRVRSGDLILEVARRTAHVIIRVHDPRAPQLAAFTGIPAYAPDARWIVTGTFEPFDQPRTVTTGAVVEGLEHHHTAAGTVHFELAGVAQSLVVFDGGARGLSVLFRDATSGVTTYPASRTLGLGALHDDGTVTLDFNRAANLPCGLTEFATCPIPPAENVLTVAVEAGEQWVR
ncbi:DUF1684 domain-containing protein [Cellulomonas sp. URHE0023]|uniref:DUF1684 domain-containing protein n=1 Tax=Cellulomonas sp. URHE0023 TaxID=1380354 RepID=UPI00048395FD|nr:DUF1684 domain-containing protein [Cellulomonas sp. URHE0023]